IKDSTVVTNWGWGICQIDHGTNFSLAVTAEVYDWHHNVEKMNLILREKDALYDSLIRMYRNTYQSQPGVSWSEPSVLTTNVSGRVVTAYEWGVLTLYNGTKSVPLTPIGSFGSWRSPVKFNSVTSSWKLYSNDKDYAKQVFENRELTEVE
ncbi:MAG: hypothetical protein ACI4TC_05175, partial [Kiritimatiellia bacterium]